MQNANVHKNNHQAVKCYITHCMSIVYSLFRKDRRRILKGQHEIEYPRVTNVHNMRIRIWVKYTYIRINWQLLGEASTLLAAQYYTHGDF